MNTIIAIMGATGAGKSSFIQTLTGQSVPLSHGLESSTTSITAYTCQHPDGSGRTLTVLDTPGLDGGDLSDADIIQNILTFIEDRYDDSFSLAGILFLHRISDFRLGGQASRALNTFRALTSSASFGKVMFVTTMWDLVEPAIGEKREAALRGTYWRPMLSRGAKMERFENTQASAMRIVSPIGSAGPSAPVNPAEENQSQLGNREADQPQPPTHPPTHPPQAEHGFRSKVPYRYITFLLGPATSVGAAAIGWTAELMDWVVVERPSVTDERKRPHRTHRFTTTAKILLWIKWPGMPPIAFP